MNLLVTIDQNYLYQLGVMMNSLLDNHQDEHINLYIMHRKLTNEHIKTLNKQIVYKNYTIYMIEVDPNFLENFKTTYRYPSEIYYRLFCARLLPSNLDRILYLDPDLVVIKNIKNFYNLEFGSNYFAGATHVGKKLHYFIRKRIHCEKNDVYLNTGVLLINLQLLRKEQNENDVLDFVNKYNKRLQLPDQDILCKVYGKRCIIVDTYIYNLSDRMIKFNNVKTNSTKINLNFIEEKTRIIHYCGKNKPWKEKYNGILDKYYHYYENLK